MEREVQNERRHIAHLEQQLVQTQAKMRNIEEQQQKVRELTQSRQ